MLHDISQMPEVFERLLTLSYRKNLILTVIPSVSLLREFIIERQYGNLLETLSRDDVRKARDYFLGRKHIKPEPAPEPEERKPEQLEFDFSAAESACRAVCAFRSEDDLIEASRKLNRSSSLHLAAGSAGVFKISAHYWLKHPEAVPAPETLEQIKEQYREGIALLDRIIKE